MANNCLNDNIFNVANNRYNNMAMMASEPEKLPANDSVTIKGRSMYTGC